MTVMRSKPLMGAMVKPRFAACAVDLIQPDGPWALPKGCIWLCWQDRATAQLSTHHLSISQAPWIITHRPPLSTVEDLYSTSAGAVSIDQTDLPLNCWAVVCRCCGSEVRCCRCGRENCAVEFWLSWKKQSQLGPNYNLHCHQYWWGKVSF